jgi:hypothetical protein
VLGPAQHSALDHARPDVYPLEANSSKHLADDGVAVAILPDVERGLADGGLAEKLAHRGVRRRLPERLATRSSETYDRFILLPPLRGCSLPKRRLL